MPSKGFNIHASKSNPKRNDDDVDKGPSAKRRKKQEAAAKAATAAAALTEVPGAESWKTSEAETGKACPA